MKPNRNIPEPIKQAARWRANGKCTYCQRKQSINVPFEFDHRVALANGGKTTKANIQFICARCNRRKGDKVFTADLEFQLREMAKKDLRYPAIKAATARFGENLAIKTAPTIQFRIR